jgi:hypothetical protein
MTENPWIPLLDLTGTYNINDLTELDTEQLIARATKAAEDAEKETSFGETIGEILDGKGESAESQKSLATIGAWHFECAEELFNKALRNFERAKSRGLSKEQEKQVESQIKICQKHLSAVAKQKKSAGNLLAMVQRQ